MAGSISQGMGLVAPLRAYEVRPRELDDIEVPGVARPAPIVLLAVAPLHPMKPSLRIIALSLSLVLGTEPTAHAWGGDMQPELVRLQAEALALQKRGRQEQALVLAQRAVDLAAETKGRGHPHFAAALVTLGCVQRDNGDTAAAEATFGQVVDMGKTTLSPYTDEVILAYLHLAELYRMRVDAERFTKGMWAYDWVIERLSSNEPSLELIVALNGAADILHGMNFPDNRTGSLAQRAFELCTKLFPGGHPELTKSLNTLWEVHIRKGDSAKAEDFFRRFLEAHSRHPIPDHELALRLQRQAGICLKANSMARGYILYSQSLAAWEKFLGAANPGFAERLAAVGGIYLQHGEVDRAEPCLRRALGIWSESIPDADERMGHLHNSLGDVYRLRGDYDKSIAAYERGMAVWVALFGADCADCGASLNNLALVHTARGDFEQAEFTLKKALGIREKCFGRDSVECAVNLGNLAAVYEAKCDFRRSEECFLKAVSVIESKGAWVPKSKLASLLNNLGGMYLSWGRLDKADAYTARALAIAEEVDGKQGLLAGICHNGIGRIRSAAGEHAKADAEFAQALAIVRCKLGARHETVGAVFKNIAENNRRKGDFKAALDACRQAMEIYGGRLPRKHWRVADLLVVQAAVQHDSGALEPALASGLEALGIREKLFGASHPDVGEVLALLERIYIAIGRADDAEEMRRRAAFVRKPG